MGKTAIKKIKKIRKKTKKIKDSSISNNENNPGSAAPTATAPIPKYHIIFSFNNFSCILSFISPFFKRVEEYLIKNKYIKGNTKNKKTAIALAAIKLSGFKV
jgi:hypothetical protein